MVQALSTASFCMVGTRHPKSDDDYIALDHPFVTTLADQGALSAHQGGLTQHQRGPIITPKRPKTALRGANLNVRGRTTQLDCQLWQCLSDQPAHVPRVYIDLGLPWPGDPQQQLDQLCCLAAVKQGAAPGLVCAPQLLRKLLDSEPAHLPAAV